MSDKIPNDDLSSKTNTFLEIAEREKLKIRYMTMSALDEGDLIGWPKIESNDEFEHSLFIDEINKVNSLEVLEACISLIKSTTIPATLRFEGPCKQCSRTNDVGSNKCWWCEVDNPT